MMELVNVTFDVRPLQPCNSVTLSFQLTLKNTCTTLKSHLTN